jgi:uncharacterized protein
LLFIFMNIQNWTIKKTQGWDIMENQRYINIGNGPLFQTVDIGNDNYVALINPDTAFWSLVRKDKLLSIFGNSDFIKQYREKEDEFLKEMNNLRFGLKPSAVYLNPTDKCNLNCIYCYIPEEIRKNGAHMSEDSLFKCLSILKDYFKTTVSKGQLPQVIFHGSEPLMNVEAVFKGIEKYKDDFYFGLQTNATLLDQKTIDFLTSNKIGIGISLDGFSADVADGTRKDWAGKGYFETVVNAIKLLKDYENFNVICTVTRKNLEHLATIIDFFHACEIKTCMLNIVRCTQERSRTVKPDDVTASIHYLKALDRTYELYRKTGRKLIVANFANILLSILAPTARRLMCDISPCGGGRCFFAVNANGDIFPCSEFVGVPEFNGGNVFTDSIQSVLDSEVFKPMVERRIENIQGCKTCSIRHFCGSPCPAEAYTMNGGMDQKGAFCDFYVEQVRYAFRMIAEGKEQAYLEDNWDSETKEVFNAGKFL